VTEPASPEIEWRKVVAAALGALAAASWSFASVVAFGDDPGRPIYEVLLSIGGFLVVGFAIYLRRPDDERTRVLAATGLLVAAGAGLGLLIGYGVADRDSAGVALAGLIALVAGPILAVAAAILWVADPRTRLAVATVVLEIVVVGVALIAGALLRDPLRTVVIVVAIAALLPITLIGLRSARTGRPG
jgi:drug/metabolite transporter (DMT)-like permease